MLCFIVHELRQKSLEGRLDKSIVQESRLDINVFLFLFIWHRGSLYRLLHRPSPQLDEKRRMKMAHDVVKYFYILLVLLSCQHFASRNKAP